MSGLWWLNDIRLSFWAPSSMYIHTNLSKKLSVHFTLIQREESGLSTAVDSSRERIPTISSLGQCQNGPRLWTNFRVIRKVVEYCFSKLIKYLPNLMISFVLELPNIRRADEPWLDPEAQSRLDWFYTPEFIDEHVYRTIATSFVWVIDPSDFSLWSTNTP